MNKIEIEIKLPLLNQTEVIRYLEEKAAFECESHQVDYYYNAPHRNFLENPQNICEWLRLRVSGDKYELNYKDWLPHDEKIKTHCKELETKVTSFDDLRDILEVLDFKLLITVDKIRKSWMLDDVEISIDSVANLGSFIEIEYKGNKTDDIDLIRTSLFDVLKKIGAETKEVDLRGYPFLILEREGYFKK